MQDRSSQGLSPPLAGVLLCSRYLEGARAAWLGLVVSVSGRSWGRPVWVSSTAGPIRRGLGADLPLDD